MSDEVQNAIDAINEPSTPVYREMPDAYNPEPPKKEREYSSEESGLREAADAVTERRAEEKR